MKINWDSVSVHLKNIGRVHCEPGWRLDARWSSYLKDFDLWFVSEGLGQMQLHDTTIELRPGVCLWMRPGGRYEATQDPDKRLIVSYAHFDLLDRTGQPLSLDAPLPPEVLTPANTSLVDILFRHIASHTVWKHLPYTHRSPTLALFRGLLMELDANSDRPIHAMAGTAQYHRQLIQTAAMHIMENPGQDYRVADLARQAGYSPDHFTRVFKEVIGVSPQAYIVRVRMDRAKQLLLESSLSISQIADTLGYTDLFFFSRQFKSTTGKTPRQYRTDERA